MKAIILAAGYATRLGKLTENMPKSLLKINNKPIIDYICEEIEKINVIDSIYVISNHKFYSNFIEWKNHTSFGKDIVILDDGSTFDGNKLGAIGDISFTIDKMNIDDDLLIIAGDNFFTYSLVDFYNYFLQVDSNCICVQWNNSLKDLRRMGVAEVNNKNKIIGFEEKPENPKSNLAVYATYIYTKYTLPLFRKYLSEGNNPDAPGYFPAWLYRVRDIYTYDFLGECYDIGIIESYNEVNTKFTSNH